MGILQGISEGRRGRVRGYFTGMKRRRAWGGYFIKKIVAGEGARVALGYEVGYGLSVDILQGM